MNYHTIDKPLDQIKFEYTEEDVRWFLETNRRTIARLEANYVELENHLPEYKSVELTQAKIAEQLLLAKLADYEESGAQLRKAARKAFALAYREDILLGTAEVRKRIVKLAREKLNYSAKTNDNDVWNPLHTICIEEYLKEQRATAEAIEDSK